MRGAYLQGVTAGVTGGNICRYNHRTVVQDVLKGARDASARGDWERAYQLLVEADAGQLLDGPGLALYADCAYAAGHLDVTIDAWERVHAEGLRAGDPLMAAGGAVRVALHLLFDTALMAPIRGWVARTERLLEGEDDTPVHAWVAVVRSYERLLSGDFRQARQWARRAIHVGTGRDPAAVAMGRVAEARSLILEGEVARGLDLLNEAAVATMSGELDPLITGVVYCEVVCAMQALAQYDLADQWTQAMERWRQGQPVGASTDGAAFTVPRSFGCVGLVSRPRAKRSRPVRSCARIFGGSSGGRSPNLAGFACVWETSRAPKRRSFRPTRPGGSRNRASHWSVWLKVTWRWRLRWFAKRSIIP